MAFKGATGDAFSTALAAGLETCREVGGVIRAPRALSPQPAREEGRRRASRHARPRRKRSTRPAGPARRRGRAAPGGRNRGKPGQGPGPALKICCLRGRGSSGLPARTNDARLRPRAADRAAAGSIGQLANNSASRPAARLRNRPFRRPPHPGSGVPARRSSDGPIALRPGRRKEFVSGDDAGSAAAATAAAGDARPGAARHIPAAGVLRATAGRARPLSRSAPTDRFSA